MKQGLRWVVMGFAGLLVAVVAIWAASRLWGVSSQQRAVLAQMRSEWKPVGRNAFDALWTLQHDVPVERQRAITEADANVMRGWPPFGTQAANFRSGAAAYPDLKPERSQGWEAGLEQSFLDGRVRIDATYFDSRLKNEIYTD